MSWPLDSPAWSSWPFGNLNLKEIKTFDSIDHNIACITDTLYVRSVRLGLVGILIDLRWNVEETELFVQGLNGKHGFVTLRKIFSVCKRNKIKILF